MSGLVEQLQAEALDKSVALSTLLRKAKLAAVKLNLDEAVGWIDAELNGHEDEQVPEYRQVGGEPMMHSIYHGWIPFRTSRADLTAKMSEMPIREPITSLEETLKDSSPTFIQGYGPTISHAVSRMLGGGISNVGLQVGRGGLVAILEHVRNRVFDWALDLERAGITGEGLSFSSDERQRAASAHIRIDNFHGSFNAGDASGANSRITQGSTDNSTNISGNHSVFGKIEQAVRSQVEDPEAREEIIAANDVMREAQDRAGRMTAYHRFMASAADHMGVILPLLPALTSVVMGVGK